MGGWIACALCKRGEEFGMPTADLIILPPDFTKYTHFSSMMCDIVKEYDPRFLCGSLDEVYLDLTVYLRARAHANNVLEIDCTKQHAFARDALAADFAEKQAHTTHTLIHAHAHAHVRTHHYVHTHIPPAHSHNLTNTRRSTRVTAAAWALQ